LSEEAGLWQVIPGRTANTGIQLQFLTATTDWIARIVTDCKARLCANRLSWLNADNPAIYRLILVVAGNAGVLPGSRTPFTTQQDNAW